MSEIQHERKIFSLLEVTQSIQRTLTERYGSVFWVKAEMNKLNHYPHSGHCYPDLVEKKDGKVIAQLRSTLWKDDYLRINHSFLKVVKTPLKEGISMLCCARIIFDPVHGLSLRIMDIDPVFSLGELEREKQDTIDRLKSETIFDRNKSLSFPLLPQRIAIISVETSKGYADFQKVIGHNPGGYRFFHVLFPSVLQGERAVESMLYQLKRIRKVISHFDVVAIIRGGGGEVGLSCFNDYNLTREIALFPIPVITGIGHATNETVAEMIAFKNAITPTDLANFLLQKFHAFAEPVAYAQKKIVIAAQDLVRQERVGVTSVAKYFRSVTENILMQKRHDIRNCSTSLVHASQFLIHTEKEMQRTLPDKLRKDTTAFIFAQRMNVSQQTLTLKKDTASFFKSIQYEVSSIEKSVQNMDPENVLKRGYSITRLNGKAVKSIAVLKPHDTLNTVVADGQVISEVKSVKENDIS
jgi:exodeoxyribonuclease VII large subunit